MPFIFFMESSLTILHNIQRTKCSQLVKAADCRSVIWRFESSHLDQQTKRGDVWFKCIFCKKTIKSLKKEYKQHKQFNKEVIGYIQCPHCGRFQLKLRLFIYNRDKFTCQKCGVKQNKLEPNNYLTRHHIIGKCNGSAYKVETLTNNITWCWECHRKYNKRNPMQFITVPALIL